MTDQSGKIECKVCGAYTHAISMHLKEAHPDMTTAQYSERFPGAPLLSEAAKRKLAERTAISAAKSAPTTVSAAATESAEKKAYFHEVFELPEDAPGARNALGNPIPVTILSPNPELEKYIPEVDKNHVWDIENLKNTLMAFELNIPFYEWGHAGTGKTTDILNVCARTRRPAIRVQHTANTEESHILGQRIAVKGETPFVLGPLPFAMKHGLVYIADEYDFGMPSVLAVYQPVLEGGALIIKEADPADRVITPHPNFRFAATGNTNGSGDDTGLYQGTLIQNAANYDRFGMVIEKKYMAKELEAQIVEHQGGIGKKDAIKLVDFATKVRESFQANKISNTISPRTLINAARIGVRRGNMRTGIALSYGNKLNKVDREVVDGIAQRIFG